MNRKSGSTLLIASLETYACSLFRMDWCLWHFFYLLTVTMCKIYLYLANNWTTLSGTYALSSNQSKILGLRLNVKISNLAACTIQKGIDGDGVQKFWGWSDLGRYNKGSKSHLRVLLPVMKISGVALLDVQKLAVLHILLVNRQTSLDALVAHCIKVPRF